MQREQLNSLVEHNTNEKVRIVVDVLNSFVIYVIMNLDNCFLGFFLFL